jgi:hypothetical protein
LSLQNKGKKTSRLSVTFSLRYPSYTTLLCFDDFTQSCRGRRLRPPHVNEYAASQQCIAMMAHAILVLLGLLTFFASAAPVDMPTTKRDVEATRAEVQPLASASEVSSCSLDTILYSTQIRRKGTLSLNHPPRMSCSNIHIFLYCTTLSRAVS